jgi:chromosomal replication initiation ATPase DnaA
MSEQLPLPLAYRTAMGVEDFFIAPCNEQAVAWFDRWPDWPSPGCVLTGPKGSGKTHLVTGFAERSKARLLRPGQLHARLKAALLIVDPMGPDNDQEALFHLFNRVKVEGGQLVVVCETPPQRWVGALPDLVSRLATLPHISIGAPDDAVLGAVMIKQFRDRGLSVDPGVIAYALARLERSFAAVAAFTAAIDRAALAARRNVSIALAGQTLKSLSHCHGLSTSTD